MEFTDYGFYRIRCTLNGTQTRTGGYLHVPGASRGAGVGITQHAFDDVYEGFHFDWLLIAAGTPNHHYIVNRRSGLSLRVKGVADGTQVTQDVYTPSSDAEFRFVLETAPEAPSSYRIASFPTGNVLLVDHASPVNQGKILAFPENITELRRGHATFELTLVGSIKGVPATDEEQAEGSVAVRQLPQIRRLDQELPASFPADDSPVLERQFLPFFVVNDPSLARYRQVKESPYYTLEHRRRWDKVLDRQFDGRTERKTTETVVVGMTQLEASSFRSTFNWSVGTTLKASYGGPIGSASASVTAKVGQETESLRQQSTELSTNRTRSDEVTYPAIGTPYRIVTWIPVDVYALCRKDGPHPVQTWTVRAEGEDVTMFFAGEDGGEGPGTG